MNHQNEGQGFGLGHHGVPWSLEQPGTQSLVGSQEVTKESSRASSLLLSITAGETETWQGEISCLKGHSEVRREGRLGQELSDWDSAICKHVVLMACQSSAGPVPLLAVPPARGSRMIILLVEHLLSAYCVPSTMPPIHYFFKLSRLCKVSTVRTCAFRRAEKRSPHKGKGSSKGGEERQGEQAGGTAHAKAHRRV